LIVDTKLGFEKYFDYSLSDLEINLLEKLVQIAPKCVNHLKGHTLSNQMKWINNIIKKFEYDLLIAISILEEYTVNNDLDLEDDMNLLILELGVRKKITSDPRNKVKWIFGDKTDEKEDNENLRWVKIEEIF
jgi:hypothetical protein